ncbi:MAG: T9SS type A sorting domain-containing protein [Bacteroidetes bacterium]|nr:T9SS type A sorting domain-containing protein [Bacteroidota bacterium]
MKKLVLLLTAFCAFAFYACKKDSAAYPPPPKPITDTVTPFKLQNSVYPNPNNGIFTINTNTPDSQSVTIISMLGTTVLNFYINGTTKVVYPNLPAGIYLLRFSSKWGTSYYKIIKQ